MERLNGRTALHAPHARQPTSNSHLHQTPGINLHRTRREYSSYPGSSARNSWSSHDVRKTSTTAASAAVVLVLRTSWEDRLLRAELPGYDDYSRRVRWRLVPGVW